MENKKRLIDANVLFSELIERQYREQTMGILVSLYPQMRAIVAEQPTVVAIPLTAAELNHLINDTIAYIWRLEKRGHDKPEFGYDSRKALLEKLKKFHEEHFPEITCPG